MDSKLTRRAFLLGAAGTGAAMLAACANPGEDDTDGGPSGTGTDSTKVSFVLDYSPNVNHTGIYVAMQKGFFENEGIELEIVPVPADGSDAIIGSGGCDMGITYQDYIANSLASENPMPYTAVAAICQHNLSGIMSREEDGITHPAAMAGHRYATWNLPIELATLSYLVEQDGGNFDDVELVPYEVDDEVAGLKADLFDSVWVYEWWAVVNARLQDYPVNYFAFADMDPKFDFYTPVIAVNDAFAENNPELVRAFLRAAKRGYEFSAQNPEEAAEILLEAVPELDPDLIHAAQQVLSPAYIADADSWGVIDPDRWAAFYQWLNDYELVENPFEASA
ncbi:MAG: ABC transporter substrate-binding protein, partial [Atopobiaceae bacterium]|nr:ABC transporter substrate-binding protein [Atopobiaceae bacterium]